jgi:hypothetical protein
MRECRDESVRECATLCAQLKEAAHHVRAQNESECVCAVRGFEAKREILSIYAQVLVRQANVRLELSLSLLFGAFLLFIHFFLINLFVVDFFYLLYKVLTFLLLLLLLC